MHCPVLFPTGKKLQNEVMHHSFLLMTSFGGILSRSSRLRGETAIITIANGILLPLTLLATATRQQRQHFIQFENNL